MSSKIIMAIYQPKPDKQGALLDLVEAHLPILQEHGLATDRPALVLKASNGTIIEIFEWVSEEAATTAHSVPEVAKIWASMAAVAEFTTLNSLEEASKPFSHFDVVSL